MRVDRARGVGNLVLAKRECQASTEEPVDPEVSQPRHTFLDNMDAIAGGVEVWFEENTGYSRKVTETTVEIARALDVPDAEIKRWESARSSNDTETGRVVKSLLVRLQSSFPGADNGEH